MTKRKDSPETQGKRVDYLRKRQTEHRAAGKCLWCPEPVVEGKSLCVACLDSQRGTYEMRRINKLCVRCGDPTDGKCRCPKCTKETADYRAAKRAEKAKTT